MTTDSENVPPSKDPVSETPDFPVANVRSGGSLHKQSKMWLVTIVCLVLALAMAWQSVPDEGPQIVTPLPAQAPGRQS